MNRGEHLSSCTRETVCSIGGLYPVFGSYITLQDLHAHNVSCGYSTYSHTTVRWISYEKLCTLFSAYSFLMLYQLCFTTKPVCFCLALSSVLLGGLWPMSSIFKMPDRKRQQKLHHIRYLKNCNIS